MGGREAFVEARVNAGSFALNPGQQRLFVFVLIIEEHTPQTGDFVCLWSSEDQAQQTKTLRLRINRRR